MRLVCLGIIAAFVVAVALDIAGLIDLRASAFQYLMGLLAVAFVAQAWARQGDRKANDG
jgi:hypothetical protein